VRRSERERSKRNSLITRRPTWVVRQKERQRSELPCWRSSEFDPLTRGACRGSLHENASFIEVGIISRLSAF
jgi:hypothetical protein